MFKRNEVNNKLEELYLLVTKKGLYGNKGNLKYYLKFLLNDLNLKGKNVLDIGGGYGLLSLYASACGAKMVKCLEPEGDGSTGFISTSFKQLKNELNFMDVEMISETLQNYESEEKYDIIFLNNSINHLDEEACINLLTDPLAKRK